MIATPAEACPARKSSVGMFLPRHHRPQGALVAVFLSLISLCSPAQAHAGGAIRTSGDVLQIALPAATYGATFGLRDWTGSLEYTESLGTTLGATYALKYTVDERRPNGGAHSFPSGHTSASVSAAEFIRKRYGWEYGVPAYALAGYVGYTRVASGEHYPHDVLAGAAIGFVSSFVFTRPYHGFRAAPLTGPHDAQGVKFVHVW